MKSLFPLTIIVCVPRKKKKGRRECNNFKDNNKNCS